MSTSFDLSDVELTEANAPEVTAAERTLLTWMLFAAVTARMHAQHRGEDRHRHYSYQEFVLEYGRLFTPAELPDDLAVAESGRCFANAHRQADTRGKELVFVEGFATSESVGWMGIEHAWCARWPAGTDALDLTWRPIGGAYVGVPFTHMGRWHNNHRRHPHMLSSGNPFGRSVLREGAPDVVLPDVGRPLPAAARLPEL